jgi:hypothetical protein
MQVIVTENEITINGKAYGKNDIYLCAKLLEAKGLTFSHNRKGAISNRHMPLIAKAVTFIKENGDNYDQYAIVINKNLRYGKSRSRKAIKIGQSNDRIAGYPIKVIWLEIKEDK